MKLPVASIDPTLATLILAVLVLVAGVGLIALVLLKNVPEANSKQVFTAVGVLFGLLAAGGVGGLFANKAAESAADSAAKEVAPKAATAAANQAANQVSGEVSSLVESALEAEPESGGK
ncbi:MAG TPA: hypothetical protein VGO13_09465 [Solirubrobacterales bacterium]|jgi:hypothetical protein|nr:hypothetical protein [Solirubrobacterales bacterium]